MEMLPGLGFRLGRIPDQVEYGANSKWTVSMWRSGLLFLLYLIVPYCTVFYCTVLYFTVLYFDVM